MLLLLLCGSLAFAQQPPYVRVEFSVSKKVAEAFHEGGHLVLHFTRKPGREPRFRYGVTLGYTPVGWTAAGTTVLDTRHKNVVTYGMKRLFGNRSKKVYYQVVYRQNINDEVGFAPGNLYSDPDSCVLTNHADLDIVLDHVIPPDTIVHNRFVKTVFIRSKYLSDFSHRTRHIRAAILLPSGYYNYPNRVYPICYRIPGLNRPWTLINRLMRDDKFTSWWFRANAPQVIYVFLDSRGPYGDTYQMNSANNGPCATALTRELIPAVEHLVRYKGGSKLRFLTGYSTGGWVSLALQIFYPDMFNGVWSYSPDPVDFSHFGLINIYKDTSVFYNRFGYLQPSHRTIYGEPTQSMLSQIRGENSTSVTGNYLVSGGQFGAYNAVWGPRAKDGLPTLMFDPVTGRIDHAVAKQWEKYDLTLVLQRHWSTLGPKLQGKIWIWAGDMDGLYSNVATWFLKKFLDKTQNPQSDARFTFAPMEGHMQAWSDEALLKMVARRAALVEAGKGSY